MSSYTIPSVVSAHPRGDRIMDVYSHLLSERIVYLGTALDAGVANALIAADTGQSVERIFEDSLHDRWYSAPEARDYGFIDTIVDAFADVMPDRARPVGIGPGVR